MSSMTFDEFIRKHQGAIYKFARAYKIDNYTVEDLYQELCMVAWKAYTTHDDTSGGTVFTFFHLLARNHLFNLSRSSKKKYYIEYEQIDRIDAFEDNANPIQDQATKDKQQAIWDYIDSIPKGHRARWYYIANMSVQRIAEIEGTTHQAISDWLRRLHKRLLKKFPNIHDYL